jgi:hypothetical protein
MLAYLVYRVISARGTAFTVGQHALARRYVALSPKDSLPKLTFRG